MGKKIIKNTDKYQRNLFIKRGYKLKTLKILENHRANINKPSPIKTNRQMKGLLRAITRYAQATRMSQNEALEYYLTQNWVSINSPTKTQIRRSK